MLERRSAARFARASVRPSVLFTQPRSNADTRCQMAPIFAVYALSTPQLASLLAPLYFS